MSDLYISTRKEQFSLAYVRALAAAAGYSVQPIEVDMYGVDLEIRDRAVRIDVQMKCTAEAFLGDSIPFDLDSRTFNILCVTR